MAMEMNHLPWILEKRDFMILFPSSKKLSKICTEGELPLDFINTYYGDKTMMPRPKLLVLWQKLRMLRLSLHVLQPKLASEEAKICL